MNILKSVKQDFLFGYEVIMMTWTALAMGIMLVPPLGRLQLTEELLVIKGGIYESRHLFFGEGGGGGGLIFRERKRG